MNTQWKSNRTPKLLSSFLLLVICITGLFGQRNTYADLLGVGPLAVPLITNVGAPGEMTYDASEGLLQVSAAPALIFAGGLDPANIKDSESFSIRILLDQDGNLIGGNPAGPHDLVLTGHIPASANVPGSPYSGVLLTGRIQAFGFVDQSGSDDRFDFRFITTGGALADGREHGLGHLYAGKDLGVFMTLEHSNFTGKFNQDFSGLPKPNVGPVEPLPPASIGDLVWNDLNRDGLQYPDKAGIANVQVDLFEVGFDGTPGTLDDIPAGTRSTDSNGAYLFNDVRPGDYFLTFGNLPENFVFTLQNQASDEASDSDVDVNGITDVISLAPGEINLNIDAGAYEVPGMVGDFVWEDVNGNGVQELSEPGVAGVPVSLYLCGPDGQPELAGQAHLETIQTAAGGQYLFEGVPPGSYFIAFNPGNSWYFTYQDQGRNDMADSDADEATGVTDCFDLTAGRSDKSRDAGLYRLATLGDRVWKDLNQDGRQSDVEPGISNVKVVLFSVGTDGVAGTEDDFSVAEQMTNAAGDYLFTELAPDPYYVAFSELPTSYIFTLQDQGSNESMDSDVDPNGVTGVVTLASGEDNRDVDAGAFFVPAFLGDFVWDDLNADGVQNPGEPGIDEVPVALYTCGGQLVDSMLTHGGGQYMFENLPAGRYYLLFGMKQGYQRTLRDQDQDLNDTKDSDADAETGVTDCFDLARGETDTTRDAGLYRLTCNLSVEKTCSVALPPAGDLLCEASIAATTLRYTGPSVSGVTVEFEGGDGGFARYEHVDLISGVTILTDPLQNGFTLDAGSKLGSKTTIRVYDAQGRLLPELEEIIHTSCSAVYYAAAPAPLDSNTPNPEDSEKGDPSPNWFVVDFLDKDGNYVTSANQAADGSSSCDISVVEEQCTKRPEELTLRYQPRACVDSNNQQPSDKWSCIGDVVGPVQARVTSGSLTYFDAEVPMGGLIPVDASSVGKNDLESQIDIELTDGAGNVQIVSLHASCSKPLSTGDSFGSLELLSFRNQEQGLVQLGANVEYSYRIQNNGSQAVTDISVLDEMLGAVAGSPIASLAVGDSVTLTESMFVDRSVTSKVEVNAMINGHACIDGPFTAEATVTVTDEATLTATDGQLLMGVCEVRGEITKIDKKELRWKLFNDGDQAVVMEVVSLSWPDAVNGALLEVKEGGSKLFDGERSTSPTRIDTWREKVDKRTIKAGDKKEFKFKFAGNAAKDLMQYQISVTLDNGCTLLVN